MPKIQSGGVKKGRDKPAYQVVTEAVVKYDPRKPVRRHKDIEHSNLPVLFISHRPEEMIA